MTPKKGSRIKLSGVVRSNFHEIEKMLAAGYTIEKAGEEIGKKVGLDINTMSFQTTLFRVRKERKEKQETSSSLHDRYVIHTDPQPEKAWRPKKPINPLLLKLKEEQDAKNNN